MHSYSFRDLACHQRVMFLHTVTQKKKKSLKEPTTQYLIEDQEMEDLIEWNFEQIEMITMLPTGNNTHYNNFSFIALYLCLYVLLSLLHMYNIKQTTICGNVVGLSAKPAVFPLFYFLLTKQFAQFYLVIIQINHYRIVF